MREFIFRFHKRIQLYGQLNCWKCYCGVNTTFMSKHKKNFDTTLYELLTGSSKKPYKVNKQTRSPINIFAIYLQLQYVSLILLQHSLLVFDCMSSECQLYFTAQWNGYKIKHWDSHKHTQKKYLWSARNHTHAYEDYNDNSSKSMMEWHMESPFKVMWQSRLCNRTKRTNLSIHEHKINSCH